MDAGELLEEPEEVSYDILDEPAKNPSIDTGDGIVTDGGVESGYAGGLTRTALGLAAYGATQFANNPKFLGYAADSGLDEIGMGVLAFAGAALFARDLYLREDYDVGDARMSGIAESLSGSAMLLEEGFDISEAYNVAPEIVPHMGEEAIMIGMAAYLAFDGVRRASGSYSNDD